MYLRTFSVPRLFICTALVKVTGPCINDIPTLAILSIVNEKRAILEKRQLSRYTHSLKIILWVENHGKLVILCIPTFR